MENQIQFIQFPYTMGFQYLPVSHSRMILCMRTVEQNIIKDILLA